jgi:adenylyl-sulfate kinase
MSSNAISRPGFSNAQDAMRRSRVSSWDSVGHRSDCAGLTVWLTGLSGAGKSTLAAALSAQLRARGVRAVVLDGDLLRKGLCAGLGYSREDRLENVARISELARSFSDRGYVVLVAVIAPYRDARLLARSRTERFVEVYVNASLETCLQRDPKGLYRRAIAGEIAHFTGVSDPYEAPLAPEVECRTDRDSVEVCTAKILQAVMRVRLG